MLVRAFAALLLEWRSLLPTDEGFLRLVHVLVGMVCTQGRHTITGSIRFRGRAQASWSADYAAFSRAKWNPSRLFDAAFAAGARHTDAVAPHGPIVIAIDDTSVKKSSRVISAARWMKDPLSPPFNVNLRLGLRFFHSAMILPLHEVDFAPRAISVGFELAPSPAKPKRKAPEEEWDQYRQRKKDESLPRKAAAAVARHREQLDAIGMQERTLLIVGDGGYTNRTLIGALPDRTQFVGRTRKDIRLHRRAPPDSRKVYGERLPTPEAMRLDTDIPYVTSSLFYGGARRDVRYKDISDVLWPGGTRRQTMRLIIMAPTPYRAPAGSGRKIDYNQPAYLLTTDLQSPPQTLVQAILDRWQIEPLHRDLKTGLGVGQAQNWNDNAVVRVHTAVVATWSLLTLAALDAFGLARTSAFGKLPSWRRVRPNHRASQEDIVQLLRAEFSAARDQQNSSKTSTSRLLTTPTQSAIGAFEQPQLGMG